MPEILTRAAGKLSSFDPEARTVDMVLATENPVRRRSYNGDYDEILVVNKSAINTARIDSGMSVLDSHRDSGMDSRIGSIVPGSFRIESGQAIVTAKLSRNPKGEAIFNDLSDGHVIGVSVGYRIEKEERTDAQRGGVATVRCVLWEPMEISCVAIPADATATTRNYEGNEMSKTTEKTTRSAADESMIVELATRANMPGMAADALRGNETLADFRVRLIDALADAETPMDSNVRVEGNGAGGHIAARIDALTARMTGGDPGNGAAFVSASLMDHARGIVESTGVDCRSLSRDEVLGRAMQVRSAGMHTTSDFSLLLQSAGRRVLVSAYEAAQSPLKTRISRMAMLSDFRAKSMLKISDGGLLEKVNEHGEVKSTTRSESAEGYSLATFARMFSISRQALINDDLGAFADFNAMAGRMAAQTENAELFNKLTEASGAGPIMGEDGVRMFHADHGNLGTPAALSVESLSAARAAMRRQTATDGTTRLNVTPAILMVGPDQETEAEKVLAQLAAAKIDDVNPFAGRLELAVESQLDGDGWYLFAAPGSMPSVEYGYLTGSPGVQVATKEEWSVLGVSYRAHLDFGCGPVDFRGAYRNAGA
jgi:hypothetical protein